MVQASVVASLVHEGPEEFLVHRRLITDPDIFELEMDKIFGRAWVYVGHESEISKGGAYKTTTIGHERVILTRDPDDASIQVLYNSCRHRGALVCHDEYGNSSYFRCQYHGWTYNNRGELVGIPRREGYGESLDLSKLGLIPVARVASYRGLIFANLSPQGPSLEEYLGNALPYIDVYCDENFELSGGTLKVPHKSNWKMGIENTVDGYHFEFVHKSVMDLETRRRPGGMAGGRTETEVCMDLGNGHSYLTIGLDERHRELGEKGFNLVIFPNLCLTFVHLRVIRPIAADLTEVCYYPRMLKDGPSEINRLRMREHEDRYGPASFLASDDQEVSFERVQKGLGGAKANEWRVFSQELQGERIDERGVRIGPNSGETSERAIYRAWSKFMASE